MAKLQQPLAALAVFAAVVVAEVTTEGHTDPPDLDRRLVHLNRYTFKENVAPSVGDQRDTAWFVHLCFEWEPFCRNSTEVYSFLAEQFQTALNRDAWLRPRVRFAYVECSTDMELCKDVGFGDYPMVARYGTLPGSGRSSERSVISGQDGELLKQWPQRLAAFLYTSLEEHGGKEMMRAAKLRPYKQPEFNTSATAEAAHPACGTNHAASCCQGLGCSDRPAAFGFIFLAPLAAFTALAAVFRIIQWDDIELSVTVLLVAAGTAAMASLMLAS